jgi:hypothetical protein
MPLVLPAMVAYEMPRPCARHTPNHPLQRTPRKRMPLNAGVRHGRAVTQLQHRVNCHAVAAYGLFKFALPRSRSIRRLAMKLHWSAVFAGLLLGCTAEPEVAADPPTVQGHFQFARIATNCGTRRRCAVRTIRSVFGSC